MKAHQATVLQKSLKRHDAILAILDNPMPNYLNSRRSRIIADLCVWLIEGCTPIRKIDAHSHSREQDHVEITKALILLV